MLNAPITKPTIIATGPLTAKKLSQNLKEILSKKKLTLKITEKAEELLAKEGFDSAYGARPLKRVIQNEVQNILAMKLLNGEVKEGDSIRIDVTGPEGRKLDFKIN